MLLHGFCTSFGAHNRTHSHNIGTDAVVRIGIDAVN